MTDHAITADYAERRLDRFGLPQPHDYVWNGRRVTHYLNHGRTWQSCPATEKNHHTLRSVEVLDA